MLARTVLACVLFAATALPCWGQSTATPGFYHGQKYIGFVPKHLKEAPRPTPSNQTELPEPTVGELEAADDEEQDEQPTVIREVSATVELGPMAEPMLAEPMIVEDFVDVGWCSLPQVWVQADYLVWWMRGMDTPPLATTGPTVPQNQAGVIGAPGTQILFGGGFLDEDRSGARVSLGYWLDDCRCKGLEATYFSFSDETDSVRATNNQFQVVSRPFRNVQTATQDARRIVFPGELQGSLDIAATSEFQSFELLFRNATDRIPCRRAEFLFGYRYANLDEQLRITESTLALAGAAPGSTIDLTDQFETVNDFHGGELGIRLECDAGPCTSWEFLAKVAIGNTRSRARISGQTTTNVGGAVAVTNQGLLTQPTNIGVYEQDEFSTIWEMGLTMRRDWRCGVTARVGYSVLLWNDVARPGEQIDFSVNPTQIPPGMLVGAARPGFAFNTTDVWAHGLHFGLEYGY